MIVQQNYLNLKKVNQIFIFILFQIFLGIENLRLEREHILTSTTGKKQRYRSSIAQQKLLDSPIQSFEQDT